MDTAEPKHGRCWGRRWMNADHLYQRSGAADGRYRAIVRSKRGVRWVMIGQGMGGIGLFVGREPALSVRDVGIENGRKRGFCAKVSERGMKDVGAENGRMQSISTKEMERRMGGCGSVVPWKWNGGWEVTDRLSYAV